MASNQEARLCQNSSTLRAPGKRPLIPMMAIPRPVLRSSRTGIRSSPADSSRIPDAAYPPLRNGAGSVVRFVLSRPAQ